ncbi:MAG: (Fe-S)-binding protein [Candidatus Omnitrophica bacterium]|nr:(Fe-S)-binding protein [Candidatus Omnitrophota bacterium]
MSENTNRSENSKTKRKYPFKIEHPTEEHRPETMINAMKDILNADIYKLPLSIYLDTCARCNTCSTTCHVYQTTGKVEDLPAYRSEKVRRIYKKYFSRSGRLFGRLAGAKELSEDDINSLLESAYRCTMCRRCNLECPMGVDNALITRIARVMLSYLNLMPSNFEISVNSQLEGETRNTSAIPRIAFLDTLEFLNEEIEEIVGCDMGFPIDKEGSEILFIAPVSDYMMEAETLMGNAVALNAAGADWTVGTEFYDAINYGLFYSDEKLEQILQCVHAEAKRLKVKKIVVGECGHATKTLKLFTEILCKDSPVEKIESVLEFTAHAIMDGKIKLDPSRVSETVTYHDPCNLGRMGGVLDEPRTILKACTDNFIEMSPTREENYCCGGGGGTVTMDDIYDFRMNVAGKMKADQMRSVGAHYVAAPCANCKKQIRELIDFHKIDSTVVGVHDLVLKALVLDDASQKKSDSDES